MLLASASVAGTDIIETMATKKRVLVDLVEVGRKGGEARAKKLSAKQRSESAQKAAKARWAKKKPKSE